MIDDERQDTPQEEPQENGAEAGGADTEPAASADPSESPASDEAAAEQPDAAEGATGDADLATGDAAQTPAEPAASDAEEPATEEAAEEPAAEEPAAEEPAAEPVAEEPAAGEPAAEPVAGEPEAEEPAGQEPEAAAAEEPATDAAAADAPAAEAAAEEPRRKERSATGDDGPKEEVVPGAHLEPDLVLEEEQQRPEGEFGPYETAEYTGEGAEGDGDGQAAAEPGPRSPMDLAADARYHATGKRKTAVARVILKPGSGSYSINGRELDEFFPRKGLQNAARQPLEAAGYEGRMDVVARLHGGGVSAQAGALRHGVARALVEADPHLRLEMKRRGFLTRDARVKERKKAGLKKARKRPQFSKR